jgi:hypothetical protein
MLVVRISRRDSYHMGQAKRVAAYWEARGIVAPQNQMARSGKTALALEGALLRGGGVVLMSPGQPHLTRLALRLEWWRKRAGLTKVQAARVFGVPVQTWYRWIAGGEPTERNRAQLVKVLKAAKKS